MVFLLLERIKSLGYYTIASVNCKKLHEKLRITEASVAEDGSVENFYGAYLTDESTIVFKGNYGGTVFKLVGRGIEDEACRKYVSEIGTPKYYMNKIR